jgi:nitrate/nitrite transporter NarK
LCLDLAFSHVVIIASFSNAGIGMGLLYQTSCVLSSYYFNKRRGLVNGIVSCGTGVGLMVFPLFLSYVLELTGLIRTFYILAGVALQLMICGAAIIPAEKLMRRKLMRDSKEGEKGLKSIGDEEQEEIKTKKSFFDHMRNVKKNSMELKLFYKPSFCLFTLSAVLWRFAYFTPMVFLPSRAISFGHSSEATALLLTLSGAASILGRVVYGLLADVQRLRQFRPQLFASAFIFAGLVSVVNFGEEYYHQILYAMLYGAFLGE